MFAIPSWIWSLISGISLYLVIRRGHGWGCSRRGRLARRSRLCTASGTPSGDERNRRIAGSSIDADASSRGCSGDPDVDLSAGYINKPSPSNAIFID
ncbi:hypothetical protein KCV07_g472, partial [Aureobasidium melanogenum]